MSFSLDPSSLHCNATMILAGGEEISGRVLVAAIDRIEREIVNEAA